MTVALAAAMPAPLDRARDRTMGTLIILFALSILAEGILRKWLLNPIEKPLYFVREPFLFAIYWYYLYAFRVNRKWIQPFLLYAFLVSGFALVQNIYWQYPILVPLLAIRFFVIYLPLAFIMWDTLTERQLRRLIRVLLWVSVPVALLVMMQFMSPVASPINKGISDDVESRFVVIKDVIRPYGPFTFVLGQNAYAGIMTGIVLAVYDQRRRFRPGTLTLLSSAMAVLVMGALSGGRTYFAYLILTMLAYIMAGLFSGRIGVGVKRLFIVAIFAAMFLVTFVLVFPRAYEAMSTRQSNATAHEGSTVQRAISMITGGGDVFGSAPLFGTGAGSGINGARSSVGVSNGFVNGEYEWARIINEFGPLFGSLMLIVRTWLTVWLAWGALRLNIGRGDGSALILWGVVGPMLMTAQITMQNSMLGLNWFAIGLMLAMIRQGRLRPRRTG